MWFVDKSEEWRAFVCTHSGSTFCHFKMLKNINNLSIFILFFCFLIPLLNPCVIFKNEDVIPTRNAFIFLLEHFLQTRPFFGAQCSFESHAPFCIWSTNHTNGARIFGVCAPFGAYIIKLEHLFYLGMKVENWICLLSSNQSSSLYPINQWECLKLPLHWTHVHKTVST